MMVILFGLSLSVSAIVAILIPLSSVSLIS